MYEMVTSPFQRELVEIQKAIRGEDSDTPKDSLVNTLQLPPSWLEQAWKNEDNRRSICEHQKLPIGFIAERWCNMNSPEQSACCQYQTLTPEFIKAFWIHMHSIQKEICCEYQPVPVELIRDYWDMMSDAQRRLCVWRQKFFEQLSPGELPEFLTDKAPYIRRAAIKSITKHARKEAQRERGRLTNKEDPPHRQE